MQTKLDNSQSGTVHMVHVNKVLEATDKAEDAGKLMMSSNQSKSLKPQKRLRGFDNLGENASTGRRHRAQLQGTQLLKFMQLCMQTGYAQQQYGFHLHLHIQSIGMEFSSRPNITVAARVKLCHCLLQCQGTEAHWGLAKYLSKIAAQKLCTRAQYVFKSKAYPLCIHLNPAQK